MSLLVKLIIGAVIVMFLFQIAASAHAYGNGKAYYGVSETREQRIAKEKEEEAKRARNAAFMASATANVQKATSSVGVTKPILDVPAGWTEELTTNITQEIVYKTNVVRILKQSVN